MQYRQFGRTGWQVSEITFGAWQLGGTWGAISDKESIDTLHCAFDHGINMVDTAAAYGQGQSERVIAQALKQSSAQVYIASKIAPLGIAAQSPYRDSIDGRFPAQHIIDSVDASLSRLGVECIDLMQLHLWFSDGHLKLEWHEALSSLVQAGKIRAFGVSLPDIQPQVGVALAQTELVTSQQVIYNLFEQEPDKALFRAGEETGTAFIARVPFDSGALTGTWNENTYQQWSTDDKRHAMYQGGNFSKTLSRIEKLKAACAPYYPTLAEAAMRFCLSDKAVSTIACGMRNREEVVENIKYCDGELLPEALRKGVAEHQWKHNFY